MITGTEPMLHIKIPIRDELLATFPIGIRGYPLARPRARRRVAGVYTPMENQKEMINYLKAFDELNLGFPALIMDSYFQFVKPRTSKDPYPTALTIGDDDNLRKALADNMVKANLLEDDRWLLGGELFKFWGSEEMVLIKLWSVSHETMEIEY